MNVHTSESRRRFRQAVESEVERLISLLDDLEGDPDLEANGDSEPILGWPAHGPQALAKYDPHDDREIEDEHDEDGGDTEPNGDEIDTSFTEDEFSGRLCA